MTPSGPPWLVRLGPLAAVLLALTLVSAGCLSASDLPVGPDGNLTQQEADGNRSNGNSSEEDPASGDEDADQGDEPNGTAEDEGNQTSGSDGTEDADNGTDDPAPSKRPPWPELSEATVRPGVQITSASGQCTSNFLFRTPDNASLMLGVAAHCVAQGAQTNVNGCDPQNEPMEPGTEVTVSGASNPGVLVYSAWWTMQANDASDQALCTSNDFALIRLDPADRGSVHPAVLHFGGPTELASPSDVAMGDKVIWYGNSGTRPSSDPAHQNEGYILRSDGRSAVAYSASPGVPGDSGSGILTGDGKALGVLSTLRVTPEAGSNDVVFLEPALAYAQENGVTVELVTWSLLDGGRLPG